MNKSRVLALLLAVLLLAMSLPITAFAASKTMYVKTENGLSLNVRSFMRIKSDNVVTHLASGTKVTVISERGFWALIEWGNPAKRGYVVKKHLSSSKPSISNASTSSVYRYVNVQIGLNMRSSMTTREDNIIRAIPYGSRVRVHEFYKSGWAKISYGGKTGYVLSRYLSKTR